MSEDWPRQWVAYVKHRRATGKSWLSGKVLSLSNDGPSQYNPMVFNTDQAVRELELACIEHGTLIKEVPDLKRTYYMKDQQNRVIGACSGQYTAFVFAEWHRVGYIHGRPISRTALEKLGVTL